MKVILPKAKMLKKSSVFLVSIFLSFLFVPAFAPQLTQSYYAMAQEEDEVYVEPRIISESDVLVPGKTIKIGVVFDLKPDWHIYYKDAGEAGMPTQVNWKLPEGFKTGELLWQKPNKFVDSGIVTYGYSKSTLIASELEVPSNLKQGDKVDISASLKWLSCKEICLPGGSEVKLSLPVGEAILRSKDAGLFDSVGFTGSVKDLNEGHGDPGGETQADKQMSALDLKYKSKELQDQEQNPLYFLGFALVGGFILNFMPCVLPVIAIKIMSFLEQADEEPGRVRVLGLVFTAGIISAFMVLAGIVLAIRGAGQSVGWGFQFQYPGFIIGMCVIVLLLSLSLFGLFYINPPAGQDGIDKLASREGMAGTFFKGVLATTLSTPCTAPFLGAALGFAFAQPAWVVAGIFFASGLGMSLPYIVLTAQPKWMKFMPKPGAWMEKFKESMGFVMLATLVWLLGVLASQIGSEGVMWTSFFLLSLALSTWIVSSFTDLTSETPKKIKVWSIAILVSIAGLYLFVIQQPVIMQGLAGNTSKKVVIEDSFWKPFSVSALDKAIADKQTVFLDFTADWCLTCKVNEKTVIGTEAIRDKIKALKVVPMKADWTNKDPDITKMLSAFGRSGVPLYVIYPAGKPSDAEALPDGLLTQQMVIDALDRAGPSKN